ncbi:hypothetical protein BGZ70_005062, partial [Mortierella alpina]
MVTSDTPQEGQLDEEQAEQRQQREQEERQQQRQQRRQLKQQNAKHRDQAAIAPAAAPTFEIAAAEAASAHANAFRPEHGQARYPAEYHDYERLREHQKPHREADGRMQDRRQEVAHDPSARPAHAADPASYPAHPPRSRGRTYGQERDDPPLGSADSSPHTGYAQQDGGEYHEDRRQREQGQEDGQQGSGSFEHEGSGSGSGGHAGPGVRVDPGRHGAHHPRIRSAPHSFPSQQRPQHHHQQHATVSHHPNAINRYPFSIPSISAKLDQPHPEDGSDALSSLWK